MGNTNYNESTDATVTNEFATVAFRFGHSLIPSILTPTLDPIRTTMMACPLRKHFFEFDEFVLGADMSGNAWKNMLLGLQSQQSPAMDASMSNSVIDFLFCEDNCEIPEGFGQDLAARNIQRARDHGLPGYMEFRRYCKLDVTENWDAKPENIEQELWVSMKAIYDNVDDIDPFTGGMSEDPIEGGLIGATFACIIGEQFRRLKDGDRFFFTHPNKGAKHEMGLPSKVKAAVRKRRLGDILCDNTDAARTADLVMQISGEVTNCTGKPKLLYEDIVDLISQSSTG